MKLERLFHVLVVMGGAGAAGCASDDDPAARQPPPPDAPPGGDGDATASPAEEADAGAVGSPCFCDSQACCDRGQTPAVVAPGFTCCWSTTCP
jgi:hypothetical protein